MEGSSKVAVEPSGAVSVPLLESESLDGDVGCTVIVEPPVVIVWRLVMGEPDGRVKVIGEPATI